MEKKAKIRQEPDRFDFGPVQPDLLRGRLNGEYRLGELHHHLPVRKVGELSPHGSWSQPETQGPTERKPHLAGRSTGNVVRH